jgi:hypothetical protein
MHRPGRIHPLFPGIYVVSRVPILLVPEMLLLLLLPLLSEGVVWPCVRLSTGLID